MNIKINNIKRPKHIEQSSQITNTRVRNSRGNLAPIWGVVKKSYSEDNSVDVELRNGLLLRHVLIPSKTWAGYNSNNPFGSQNLPPEKSEVLIIFPDNLIEEGVVIANRFETLGDTGKEQKKEFLKTGQERKEIEISEYGWKTTYDKDEGSWKLEHPSNADFIIEVDETNKKITIEDWNQNTLIWNGNTLELNGNSKDLVTHTELNTALQTFMNALNLHTHPTAATGPPSPPTVSMNLDISSSKATKIKTG